MSEEEFDDPGVISKIDWEDYLGRLLLIYPKSKEEKIQTKNYGERDAIRADMIVLDGPGAPDDLGEILVFPLILQGQLRRNIGKGRPNLGRLAQGEPAAKGQKPPWILVEADEKGKKIARDYLNQKPKFDDVPF